MQMKYDTNGRSHVTEGNENQKISNFNQFFSIFQPKKVIGTIQHILIPGFENQHLRMKRAILFLRISLLSSSSCPRPMPSSWRKSSWKYSRFTSVRMSGRKTVPCLRHCVRQPENSIVIGINIVFVDSVSIIVIIVNNNTNIITCQAPWRAQGDAEVLPDWRSEAKNCSWSSFWWNTWKMIMASVMITDVMRKLCHQQLQCLSRVQCTRLCLGKILSSPHYFCREQFELKVSGFVESFELLCNMSVARSPLSSTLKMINNNNSERQTSVLTCNPGKCVVNVKELDKPDIKYDPQIPTLIPSMGSKLI